MAPSSLPFSARAALVHAHDFPIRTTAPVHQGKVRAVYWLDDAASTRLRAEYAPTWDPSTRLGLMIISDRISAFECLWRAEDNLDGIPGKGAALNHVAAHFFAKLKAQGVANNHLLATPHPLVWLVAKAAPLRIEAIGRRHLAGSLMRAYALGERVFCGHRLPDGLHTHQQLTTPLLTPSTKGLLRGLEGIPEADDVNISKEQIQKHAEALGFAQKGDIEQYETILHRTLDALADEASSTDQIFVDTKIELGYAQTSPGCTELILIDEVGTPDASRYWERAPFERDGKVIERSKEYFRQHLLAHVPDADVLLNKDRFAERQAYAQGCRLPTTIFEKTAAIYQELAQTLTQSPVPVVERPREEILDTLAQLDVLV